MKKAKRATAEIRHWWGVYMGSTDGVPDFTVAQLWVVAEAPNDDPKVSPGQRVAAGNIVDMVERSARGLDIEKFVFDRLDGRPAQSLALSGSVTADPAALVTRETLEKIRLAANGNAKSEV